MKLTAESLRVKVVAIFNKPLPSLKGMKDVKILEDSTVVTCGVVEGVAEIPQNIRILPEISGKTRKNKVVYPPLKPTFAMTAIEKSWLRKYGNKIYPGNSIIPVCLDGTAPEGNKPKDAENGDGRPTAYVNHITDIVLIGVDDRYNGETHINTDYISAVRFKINPKSGEVKHTEICNEVPINLDASDWEKQVKRAVGEKFFKATDIAIDLAWGEDNLNCPAWVKPVSREEKKSQPGNGEIGEKTVADVLQQKNLQLNL